MANEDIISTLVNGISSDLPSAAKYELEKSIRGVSNQLEAAKEMQQADLILYQIAFMPRIRKAMPLSKTMN